MFDWDRNFGNTNVKKKVFILHKAILNILSDLILRENINVNEKSYPREKHCS